MENTQKGFINFWTILVILLIAGGTYVFLHRDNTDNQYDNSTINKNTLGNVPREQTNSVATANGPWITYTDPDFGFSFDYPASWGKTIGKDATKDIDRTYLTGGGTDGVALYFSNSDLRFTYFHSLGEHFIVQLKNYIAKPTDHFITIQNGYTSIKIDDNTWIFNNDEYIDIATHEDNTPITNKIISSLKFK